MIGELTRHLWQSTFFALAAGLLTLAFRRNRAKVRYGVWLVASFKFLIPLVLLMNLGRSLETWLPATHRIAVQIAAPAVSYTMEQFSQPVFAESLRSAPTTPGTTYWIPVAIFTVWLCGLATIATIRFRGWFRVRAAVRASIAIELPATVEVRVFPGLLEPGVVGLRRPILLLPDGIAGRLTPSELKAVLAHELCHVRRHDNLFAAIHMIVEAIFWFHPLVWWIGARLVEERERACDEEVLSQGNQPDVYADAILNVCKLYVESPLVCVSGVSGASIRRRVEAIMSNRGVSGLNSAKKLLLASAGAIALAGPVVIGLVIGVANMPVSRAQSPASDPANAAALVVTVPAAPLSAAAPQSPTPPRPKFDVASIKPCSSGDGASLIPGGRGGGTLGGAHVSPGKLNIACMTVSFIANVAYVQYGNNPLTNNSGNNETVREGPAWARSDRYTIEAETDDPVANGPTTPGSQAATTLMGPMLQTLLEDRFRLETHREIEKVPMYALTLAKGGLKLKPMEEGACTPLRDLPRPYPPMAAGDKPRCSTIINGWNGPNRTHEAYGVGLVGAVPDLDRPVIDKTGIAGLFEIHLEYAPDENTPGRGSTARPVDPNSNIPPGPTIFTALEQQLGLKLVPDKGPRGFIVIDHIERPSEN